MNELSYYTLAHGDSAFIHQHVVDAYAAQHLRSSTSTIGAAFALAGLYLAGAPLALSATASLGDASVGAN